MTIQKMSSLPLAGKRVLIREDLNVPIHGGKISDDTRIRASLPTIQQALQAGAKVMVMSHLGRPEEGVLKPEDSLVPVAAQLAKLLGKPVPVLQDWKTANPGAGEVVMLENVRCNKGEKKNSDDLAKQYAALCDVFVMDAFATAHRAEASTHGVAKFAPVACAGPLLAAELEALGRALEKPARPLVAIVGGSKVSTKLTVLKSLSEKVDQLIVGGGIANTFILAAGGKVGKSLVEADLVQEAKDIIAAAKAKGGNVPIPQDVVVAKEFVESATAMTKSVTDIADDDLILDIGPNTARQYSDMLAKAGTIVWNGPLGVFEWDPFGKGTEVLARTIANAKAFSIAGGGDTIAAIAKYGVTDKISYISTAGGAFLEFLEGKKLPAVEVLEERGSRDD